MAEGVRRLREAKSPTADQSRTAPSRGRQFPAPRTVPPKPEARRVTKQTNNEQADESLAVGEKKVLTAIAQYPEGATREQLTILTGYKPSTRNEYIKRLVKREYVKVEASSGLVIATAYGVAALGSDFEPLPVGVELQNYWLARLPQGERIIFEIILRNFPNATHREQISEDSGYKSSTRNEYIKRLVARKLVSVMDHGQVRASPFLFD